MVHKHFRAEVNVDHCMWLGGLHGTNFDDFQDLAINETGEQVALSSKVIWMFPCSHVMRESKNGLRVG